MAEVMIPTRGELPSYLATPGARAPGRVSSLSRTHRE